MVTVRRTLPNEEICRRYLEGESAVELAAAYGVSTDPIRRRLRDAGIPMRTNAESHRGQLNSRRTPEETERLVCEAYQAGLIPLEIAKQVGIAPGTVAHILARYQIPRRPPGQTRRKRLANQEICAGYEDGKSMSQLAEESGVTLATIRTRLVEAGTKLREPIPAPSPDVEELICVWYQRGLTAVEIASWVNISSTTVYEILKRHALARRPNGQAQIPVQRHGSHPRRVHPEVQEAICCRYILGEPTSEIARDLDMNQGSVYNILHRNGVPVKISRRDVALLEDGKRRRCSKCGEHRLLGSFYKVKDSRDGYGSWCASCRAESRKNREESMTESEIERRRRHQREWRMRRKFGLEPDEYEAIMDRDNHCCAICGSTEVLVVDHDHASGTIRGALCHNCNLGIGNLRDDPEVLRSAISYLEERATPNS